MNIKQLTQTAVLTAIVTLSMLILNFSLFGSSLHLGSLVIVVISLIFPRKQALFASSIGATIFDLFTGYAIYAPFTFFARLLLSYIVSISKEKSITAQIVAALLGGFAVIAVYFLSYLIYTSSISTALSYSIADVIQLSLTVIGVFVAIPIKAAIKK